MMALRGARACLAALVMLMAAACGPAGDVPAGSAAAAPGGGSDDDLLGKMVEAHFGVPFQGERTIQVFYGPQGLDELRYTEEVAADGDGRFAVTPLDVLAPSLPWEDEQVLLLILGNREGFHFRYPDFYVRERELFLQRYQLIDTGSTMSVAGLECHDVLVSRDPNPSGVIWRLAVEPDTGLILRAQEEDGGGLLSLMEFTAIDLTPDLGSVDWHVSANQETDLDINGGNLKQLLGFEPLLPHLIPDGYQLWETTTVIGPGPNQPTWVKFVYTDGLYEVFFLHGGRQSPPPSGNTSAQVWGFESDAVRSFSMGSWTVLDGLAQDQRVIASGRVPEADLARLIQSALPHIPVP